MWLDALERHVPRRAVRTIIDLGCGTGRFSGALHDRFGARVIGIDPSRNMLAVAAAAREEGVALLQAHAGAIPLRENCADLVFLSMVWHHFPRKEEAAREIARVLRPGGHVSIRTPTLETLDSEPYLGFFPSARLWKEQMMPARQDLISSMTACGLALMHRTTVRHLQNRNPREYAERIGRRAQSDLASISDEEFQSGMERMRRYCVAAPEQEIAIDVGFFVFRASV